MKNTYEIFWSERSKSDLENILNYLDNNWTEKETRSFIQKLDKRINLISLNPLLFPVSLKKSNVRRSVLTKHTTI
ncbi:MAG: type II toxin-antitoxin system RelE/ParE family toxin [Mongoliibacter sp.]|nr:MAG: type II toxin-antitoxin system RelE/ParE family toxin [Mongoliibacter sp.]